MLGERGSVASFMWVVVHGTTFAAHKVRDILAKVYAGRRGLHVLDIGYGQPSTFIGLSSRSDMKLDSCSTSKTIQTTAPCRIVWLDSLVDVD